MHFNCKASLLQKKTETGFAGFRYSLITYCVVLQFLICIDILVTRKMRYPSSKFTFTVYFFNHFLFYFYVLLTLFLFILSSRSRLDTAMFANEGALSLEKRYKIVFFVAQILRFSDVMCCYFIVV